MKLCYLIITILLALSLSVNALGSEETDDASRPHEETEESLTRTVAAEPDVVVTLSLEHGNIIVRGWDKTEVRARVDEAEQLELRHGGTGDEKAKAARRVEVLVSNSEDDDPKSGEYGGTGNVELDVPRGAVVNLRLRQGDIEISDVAEARVESASGDVDVRRISQAAEVMCLSGSVYLRDSSGRMRLNALSGDVEAVDVRTVDEKGDFVATSMSGDVRLERVAHPRVEGRTVSGNVSFDGRLARGGSYTLKTTSGDVTLAVPADSSFNVYARVFVGGAISTDFSVKAAPNSKPVEELKRGILSGAVGTGAADVNLSSFNGTVRLRKK